MRRRWTLIGGILSLVTSAPAQWSMDGYVVTFPTSVRMQPDLASLVRSDASLFVEITRLRLRPTLDVSSSTYVRLEYEVGATYTSSTAAFMIASAPRGQILDLTWPIHSGRWWDVLHGVDRLFVKSMVGSVDLTVGRQRIAWGAGRIWNPTDLFNPINPASYSKIEKDGVDAVRATVRVGDLSDVSAVWNPQRHGRSSGAVRARTNWDGIDGAVMAGRYEDRWVIGGDVTGSIWDAGVRAEGILNSTSSGEAFTRWVAGIDNQFTARWYGMAELLYNGEGQREPTRYELGRLMSGQLLQLARRYLVVQSSYLLHPLVTAQASMLRNLDDGSGFVGGTVAISLTDESSLAIGGQYSFGRGLSEYWYYPRSLYVRTDLFF